MHRVDSYIYEYFDRYYRQHNLQLELWSRSKSGDSNRYRSSFSNLQYERIKDRIINNNRRGIEYRDENELHHGYTKCNNSSIYTSDINTMPGIRYNNLYYYGNQLDRYYIQFGWSEFSRRQYDS
jgi:hypothetical protein